MKVQGRDVLGRGCTWRDVQDIGVYGHWDVQFREVQGRGPTWRVLQGRGEEGRAAAPAGLPSIASGSAAPRLLQEEQR